MKRCGWQYCNNLMSIVSTKNIPLVNAYSCGIHVEYRCSMCDYRIAFHDIKLSCDVIGGINFHFMSHIFKITAGNYLYWSYNEPTLTNNIYYNSDRSNGYRLCNISKVIKSNPHFIYLVPEFSFSIVLDKFDENEVPDWRLLSAVKHKSFSCLICGGQFESFPSGEVFNAHPCNEL